MWNVCKKSSFWYNWKKTFALSCCCTNCGISNSNNDNRTFKEEESIEILNFIHLVDDMNGQNILLVMEKETEKQKYNYFENN